ncbi:MULTISPECIES: anti-repressor SinI family protein [Cytobacillus]|uniref:Anti-repressor SinI family protein n=1 Tax=Cytobacillus stercorigallinarum TaxID=2762240 RepID=A0ABR8QTW8_9BACI|nr:anti-repressor SinI family protein [Cytobacillus stercorigallinarum]MBD7938991.1 anti-repressor SinI family protein [Cytobacillus stercorigallinarum]
MDMYKDDNQLDTEWISLILKAKELGLSIEEVKAFLNAAKSEAK